MGHELPYGRSSAQQPGFSGEILEYRIPHHLVFALGDREAALTETCLWLGYEVLQARPASGVIQWK